MLKVYIRIDGEKKNQYSIIYVYIAAKDDAADFRDVLKHRDKQKRIKEEEEKEKINLKPVCKYRKKHSQIQIKNQIRIYYLVA